MVEGNLGGSNKGGSSSGKQDDFAGFDLLSSIDGSVASDGEGMKDLAFALQDAGGDRFFADAYADDMAPFEEAPAESNTQAVETIVDSPQNFESFTDNSEMAVPSVEITDGDDTADEAPEDEGVNTASLDDSVSRVAQFSPAAAANLDKLSQRLS